MKTNKRKELGLLIKQARLNYITGENNRLTQSAIIAGLTYLYAQCKTGAMSEEMVEFYYDRFTEESLDVGEIITELQKLGYDSLNGGVKYTRMARNLESIRDYYQITGTNEDGLNEVVEFLRELSEV